MTMILHSKQVDSRGAPLRCRCTAHRLSAAEQKPEVQRLFQSGAYEQAVDAARDGDPASTYLAAQSLMKLDRNDQRGRRS